jgi:hemoglobin
MHEMPSESMNDTSIRALVDTFYARVRDDPLLSPVFNRALEGKWDAHMPRMTAFWSKVLLGTGDFQGNVYGTHMALDGIGKEHFVRWLALFRITAIEVFERDDANAAIEIAERIATGLQLGYFGERLV